MSYGDQRKDVLAEVNNTLQDLHNFSNQVEAKSNNTVSFFILKKKSWFKNQLKYYA